MALGIFPFLLLPAEIRLPIYRYLLPYSKCDTGKGREDCPILWYPGQYRCPKILLVNRQIYEEACKVLYTENQFSLYIRHPNKPRLPVNNSRADSESFILISWAKHPIRNIDRAWSHWDNPKLSYSLLANHTNFRDIRRLHISFPPFDDLLGIDMYMKKSSYPAFYGINEWIRRCSSESNSPDEPENERMTYIQDFKGPIDEVARLVQTIPRIDQLQLSFWTRVNVSFVEYLLDEILKIHKVGKAECFYHPRGFASIEAMKWSKSEDPLLKRIEDLLQSSSIRRVESFLPPAMDQMYRLLETIRISQQLNPGSIPDWLSPMRE